MIAGIAFTVWIMAAATTATTPALVGRGETSISDAALVTAAAVKGGPPTVRLVPRCGLVMLTRIGRAPAGLELSPAVNPTQATWNDPSDGYSRACRVSIRPLVTALKPGVYDLSLTFVDSRARAGTDRAVPNNTHRVRFTRDAASMRNEPAARPRRLVPLQPAT